jgi:uroporphyrin-III C-methyltransferase/precorrin-2 dehydrogenase/sirohydrochlorin ferrochelatase
LIDMATQSAQLTTFPAFMRVDARKVAIFGNGAEAAAKARLVANTSAEISVYADAPEAELVDSLGRLGIEPVSQPMPLPRSMARHWCLPPQAMRRWTG